MATEGKPRSNRVFIIAGVVLAAAAAGTSLYISRSGSGSGGSGPTRTVVVLKAQEPARTQITQDMLTTKDVPADSAPASAYTNPGDAVNKYLAVAQDPGVPLSPNVVLTDQSQAATTANQSAPLDVHDGNVAIAVPTNGGGDDASKGTPDVVSVGCWVQAEDRIDMIIDTGQGSVRYAFQDLRVLKVGGPSQAVTTSTNGGNSQPAATPGCASVFILEVPRGVAEQLAYLVARKQGDALPPSHILQIVLRAHGQNGKGPLDSGTPAAQPKQDTPVTPQLFTQLFPAR